DRLSASASSSQRLQDSLETSFQHGDGRAVALAENTDGTTGLPSSALAIDDRAWQRFDFSRRLECTNCHRQFADPEPRRLSFNSPLGACPTCEGHGNIVEFDMQRVVPDQTKSIREGAIAPWNTPAYKHELEELLGLAGDYGIPV